MDPTTLDADCALAREFDAARLDGELTATDERRLDEHLHGCASCSSVVARLERSARSARLQSPPTVPDLSPAILARAHPPHPGRRQWVRWSLATLAAYGLLRSVPVLLYGTELGAGIHVARHLGALNAALFIGMLFAAWRPVRAFGLLPMAGALGATLLAGAVADSMTGHTHALTEAHHFVELGSVVLLWMLAGAPLPSWVPRRSPRHRQSLGTA